MANRNCLILNADYSPLRVIDWQKSITWMYKYDSSSKFGIEILDFYKDDAIVCAHNKKMPIPAVARTRMFLRLKSIKFARKNIFIRDDFTCQYCGGKFDYDDLTYDHVIPKSRWDKKSSPTCWTNIVTSCRPCNAKKDNKTPKEAGMQLLNLPEKPTTRSIKYLPVVYYLNRMKNRIPEEWKIYLPESYYA